MIHLKSKLLVVTAMVLSFNFLMAQEQIFENGIVPYLSPFSENLLILDINKGEIVSFATTGEPINSAMLNKEKGQFFLVTASHIYKGTIADGEITDQYEYYKADPDDPLAKTRFIPLGISHNGKAVLMHTGDIDITSTPPKIPTELYVADIDTKTKSVLYDITPKHLSYNFFPKTETGEILDEFIVKDSKNNKNIYVDLNTKEIIKKENLSSLKNKFPELSDYRERASVHATNKNIVTYTYSKPKEEQVKIIYNTKTDEVILNKKYAPLGKYTYGLAGYEESTDTYYLAREINNFDEPQPDINDYDAMKPGAMEKYMKASKEWRNNAFKTENFDVEIYNDKAMENVVAKFKKTRNVIIHKGKYAWLSRPYKVELYNLETKETLWSIDTDF